VRQRILLLITATTLLVVLAFAIPLVFLIRGAVGQRADDTTTRLANDIAVALRLHDYSTSQLRALVAAETTRQVSITARNGRRIGSTPADSENPGPRPDGELPGERLPDGGPPGGAPNAPLQRVAGGSVAVAFTRSQDGTPYLVRVFESDAVRYEGAHRWYLLLAGASVGLLLIGTAAGELLTRRITSPLVRTAETAHRLSVGDVTARAPTDGPREVASVGSALNRLADRIDELIAEERETVADLSHRLRTPLTALRLDAEALRNPDEAERVGAHVSTLERMLTAIIRAARRSEREGRIPACDATAVVADRVAFWSALTEEQNRAAAVSLPPGPLPVRAAAEDLAAAVDALLENVVAHTPEGTPFSVLLAPAPEGAVLEIADAGPGIPPDAELRGRSDRGSTGLGLDIARRSAEAGGGSMIMGRSARGGALVTLRLRRP
jgi:signal transduction histidine kinase